MIKKLMMMLVATMAATGAWATGEKSVVLGDWYEAHLDNEATTCARWNDFWMGASVAIPVTGLASPIPASDVVVTAGTYSEFGRPYVLTEAEMWNRYGAPVLREKNLGNVEFATTEGRCVLTAGITNIDEFLPSFRLNTSTAKLAVTGLPAGLKYDAKTGQITGCATKTGIYTVTLTVTDGKKKYVSTFTVEVEALPDWVVGTFRGSVSAYGWDFSDVCGFEVKVTSKGGVTVKLIEVWGGCFLENI